MEDTRYPFYGLMAEFDHPEALLEAVESAREAGYRTMDAYSPFPVEGVSEALGQRNNRIAWIVLGGGLTGALAGYAMQFYATVISYPLNVGGRPIHSWPAYIPITFELAILFAAFAAVLGMFALNGLPQPYHPVFNVERFSQASRDRFFLVIEARDPYFDLEKTRRFLESLGAAEVSEIEP